MIATRATRHDWLEPSSRSHKAAKIITDVAARHRKVLSSLMLTLIATGFPVQQAQAQACPACQNARVVNLQLEPGSSARQLTATWEAPPNPSNAFSFDSTRYKISPRHEPGVSGADYSSYATRTNDTSFSFTSFSYEDLNSDQVNVNTVAGTTYGINIVVLVSRPGRQNEGIESNSVAATAKAPFSGPATSFSASGGTTAGTIALTWANPSDIGTNTVTRREYRIKLTSSNTWGSWTQAGTGTTYTIGSLMNNQQYDIEFRLHTGSSSNNAPTRRLSAQATAPTYSTDYESDGDGLIEISTPAELNAIRWDLDGNGIPDAGVSTTNANTYRATFDNAADGTDCPATGCTGYELTANLDLSTDYSTGFSPIGEFTGTLDGRGKTISNLTVNSGGPAISGFGTPRGLFSRLGSGGTIRNIGLVNAQVTGTQYGATGGLAGINNGTITASFSVSGMVRGGYSVGCLVGLLGRAAGSSAAVSNSYAACMARSDIGNNDRFDYAGLVGTYQRGSITNSYAVGEVVAGGNRPGGLASGDTSTSPVTITASYWDTGTTGQSGSIGGTGGTTSELQTPTGNTGIYSAWDATIWHFGTDSQYPVLRTGGHDTTTQFARQGKTLSALTLSDGSNPISLDPAFSATVNTYVAIVGATVSTVTITPTAAQSIATISILPADADGVTNGHQVTVTGFITIITITVTAANGISSTYTVNVGTDSDGDGGIGRDYEADGDGLIEISTPAELNAIRWDLDGDGVIDAGVSSSNADTYRATFDNAADGTDCPATGCTGYELTANLDLSTDYSTGFSPIGEFTGTLDGRGKTISNLTVNSGGPAISGFGTPRGLFSRLGSGGTIRNIGLVNAQVTGIQYGATGGLAGINNGTITASFSVRGRVRGGWSVGCLVGLLGRAAGNAAAVSNSYAACTTQSDVGNNDRRYYAGLVGTYQRGSITNSYAVGEVVAGGNDPGGLASGDTSTSPVTITASYWDTGTTGQSGSIGGTGGTTSELQTPTGNTGIYSAWDATIWHFGTDSQYPVLRTGGHSTTTQFARQRRIIVQPTTGLVTTESGGQATFTVVLASQPSANVTIGVSSSEVTEGQVSPAALTFAMTTWNTPQTVTVTGQNDNDSDGSQSYTIMLATATSTDTNYNGRDPVDVSVINQDDDAAGVTIAPSTGLITTEDGGQVNFTVVLNLQPSAEVTIGVSSSEVTEGQVSPAALTFATTTWDTSQTVTVTGQNDAIDDDDQSYTIALAVTSSDTDYAGLDQQTVTVTNEDDDDAAGIMTSVSSGTTTEDGGIATFTVLLTSQPTTAVTLFPDSTNSEEGQVSPAALIFATTTWNTPQTVTVTGQNDNRDDGDQSYEITLRSASEDAKYSALPLARVRVENSDNDTPNVDGEGGLDGEDALGLYYAYTLANLLGDGRAGVGNAQARAALLSDLVDTDNDETYRTTLQRANEWRRAGDDLNIDGKVDWQDALVMYYAYDYKTLLGDGQPGVGQASLRRLLLQALRGNQPDNDTGYRELLRRANQLTP